jgi:hypothetical protein
MNKRLNLASVSHPPNKPSQDDWVNEFRVSSGYVAPTPYFTGNEFNTRIFLRTEDAGQYVCWQEFLVSPIKSIQKLKNQLW